MLRILYYEKSRKFCSFCYWCCRIIFYSVLEKVKRAVRVIKITKCLPYGKHLDIPELFSQENKTAESCTKPWEIQRRQIGNGCPLPHPTQTEPSWWKTEKKKMYSCKIMFKTKENFFSLGYHGKEKLVTFK